MPPRPPLFDRVMAKVSPEPNTGCWLWTAKACPLGYGRIHARRPGRYEYEQAHRLVYELHRGDIPKGLELDHECNVHSCVNPWHLRPATRQQNAKGRQRDQKCCKQGHAFTPENTYWDRRGWRGCRICRAASTRNHQKHTTQQEAAQRP